MDAFSISISLGLQHGVPLATYVKKYANMKFEPSGMTDDADLRIATSLVDYIFRRLALDYFTPERPRGAGCALDERAHPAHVARDRRAGDADDEPAACSPRWSSSVRSRPSSPSCSAAPSSATRRCVTSAATRCSAPARATCARAAARRAAARSRGSIHGGVSSTCSPKTLHLTIDANERPVRKASGRGRRFGQH